MTSTLYTFHPVADEQQTDIWIYTCQHWGTEQADRYIDGLHTKLAHIADELSLAKSLPLQMNLNVYFFHYGRHYVFFRKTEKGYYQEKIQVISLLHDSMDVPSRLREVLDQL